MAHRTTPFLEGARDKGKPSEDMGRGKQVMAEIVVELLTLEKSQHTSESGWLTYYWYLLNR
jgi:hypothetical protein